MDENLSSGNMIPGSYILQRPVHAHPQQRAHALHQERSSHPYSMAQAPIQTVFSLAVGSTQEHDHSRQLIAVDYSKADKGKLFTSDEDGPSITEDRVHGNNEDGKGKKGSLWQRMKWTDSMVRLLITIISYLSEDMQSENGLGGRRKCMILQKKGKWKLVSKVMAERGCYVSPQQCEDKFNDLNKRYKRLTDVLGRGTSCKVVENPALLDFMNHLSEKAKEDVRKILGSKQLFYEEMCSYHNGNRLHLPPDPSLQYSLQLAMRSRDYLDTGVQNDMGEEDPDVDTDDMDGEMEYNHSDVSGMAGFSKKIKQGQGNEDRQSFGISEKSQDHNRRQLSQSGSTNMTCLLPEDTKAAKLQSHWMKSRSCDLNEQKLHLQAQMFELEKQRFKWKKFDRKKDKELDKLRMENVRLKLENEHMAFELKRMEADSICS